MKRKITLCQLLIPLFLFLIFSFSPAVPAQNIPDFQRFASIKASGPTAVAVDSSENLYIVEAGQNHLLIYSSAGKYLKRLAGLDKPISIAVDNNDQIYIGNAGRGNVEVFDQDLSLLFKLGEEDGEFKQPTGIAVAGTGTIYVADGQENKIKVYHSDGSYKSFFGVSGSGDGKFNSPAAITIDESAGEEEEKWELIVSDLQTQLIESKLIGAARVQVFDLNGVFKRSFGHFGVGEGLLVKPLGLDVDNEGRIYITDAYQNVVRIFDSNGQSLGTLYDSEHPLRNPLGLAVSRNTRWLYVASLNTGSVELYKEAGDNILPTAEAGPDQTVEEGDAVLLSGVESIDLDDGIASYHWQQIDGSQVTLSDSNSVQVRFTAPDVGPAGETLIFQLTVTDHGGQQSSDTDTCTIHVTWVNAFPVVVTGPEQTENEGQEIHLDGSASMDPDDGIASYRWEQIEGIEVTLSDSDSVQVSFTAPDVGPAGETLIFQLTVTDHGGQEATNISLVKVIDTGGNSGGGGGGGCFITIVTTSGGQEVPDKTSPTPRTTGNENKCKLSKEEQQKRSLEVFRTILTLSGSGKRSDNLEQIITSYYQIINQYPEAPLAQESYWRLIEIFFKDFDPPEKDKALSLYQEFMTRYPDSPLKMVVDTTVGRLLYLKGYWNDLLILASPSKEDFNDPKSLKSPLPIFYYSEAKFHLLDYREASRGYNLILTYFPNSRMAMTAGKRMDEIKKIRTKKETRILTGEGVKDESSNQ